MLEKLKNIPLWAKVLIGLYLLGMIGHLIEPSEKPSEPIDWAAKSEAKKQKEAEEFKRKQAEKHQDTLVDIAHRYIQASLNDPGSVEWKGTYVWGETNTVCVEFSAKNAFGGRMQGYSTFIDGKFTINNLKAWNSVCGKGGYVRYY